MELHCYFESMTKAFNYHRLREDLTSRFICFFLTSSTQTAYTKVLHLGTHDPIRLSVTWSLILYSFLLTVFIMYNLLHKRHYAVTSPRIIHSEPNMEFAKRLHYMTCRCRNVFSNPELVNGFKQRLPDPTLSVLSNNLRGLSALSGQDLDHAKQYALVARTASLACQASSVSTSTFSTPRQRTHAVYHNPNYFSMASFLRYPSTSFSASMPPTTQGVGPTKLPLLQVKDDCMVKCQKPK